MGEEKGRGGGDGWGEERMVVVVREWVMGGGGEGKKGGSIRRTRDASWCEAVDPRVSQRREEKWKGREGKRGEETGG